MNLGGSSAIEPKRSGSRPVVSMHVIESLDWGMYNSRAAAFASRDVVTGIELSARASVAMPAAPTPSPATVSTPRPHSTTGAVTPRTAIRNRNLVSNGSSTSGIASASSNSSSSMEDLGD